MKNKKLKVLIGMFFATAMALSVGTALSVSKPLRPAEIVLAEDEEPETPTSSEESETPDSSEEEQTGAANEETPSANEGAEATATSESSEEAEEESKPEPISTKDILKILAKTFRDAIKDLIEHIKRWLKLN